MKKPKLPLGLLIWLVGTSPIIILFGTVYVAAQQGWRQGINGLIGELGGLEMEPNQA